MKMRKICAGMLAVAALLAAAPAVMPTYEFGIVASAEEGDVTFTGTVKKIISVGILVVPDDAEFAEIANQFMVKYSSTSEFNVGDTVTISYSGEPSVDNGIATVTATSIVSGTAVQTEVETEIETETETEAKTEAETETEKKTEAETEKVTETKTTTSTPSTGEPIGVILGVGTLTALAIAAKKITR